MTSAIASATREHAVSMAPHVREIEAREIEDSHGFTPEAALLWELQRSASAWTWLVDGEPACMFGIVPPVSVLCPAASWLLSTPMIEGHVHAFGRASRAILAELLERYPQITGMVDSRHVQSVRWLKWLGAQVGEPQPWGIAGARFHRFDLEVRHGS